MTHTVVTFPDLQQSASLVPIHVSTLFQILFTCKLLKGIEQSSLGYTMDPCWLSTLNIAVCARPSQTPNLSLHLLTFSPGNQKLFSKSLTASVL